MSIILLLDVLDVWFRGIARFDVAVSFALGRGLLAQLLYMLALCCQNSMMECPSKEKLSSVAMTQGCVAGLRSRIAMTWWQAVCNRHQTLA